MVDIGERPRTSVRPDDGWHRIAEELKIRPPDQALLASAVEQTAPVAGRRRRNIRNRYWERPKRFGRALEVTRNLALVGTVAAGVVLGADAGLDGLRAGVQDGPSAVVPAMEKSLQKYPNEVFPILGETAHQVSAPVIRPLQEATASGNWLSESLSWIGGLFSHKPDQEEGNPELFTQQPNKISKKQTLKKTKS